jgi:hypothetical protein
MKAEELFDQLAVDLAGEGASSGAMFGKRALLVAGKAFACLKGDDLAFRLGAGSTAHGEALGLAGAVLFDPSGKGRPFKDWVAVPVSCSARWPDLAERALEVARSAATG